MLSVKIKNILFKNPILTASGTFGYGNEIGKFVDIEKLKETISVSKCRENDLLLICAGSEKIVNQSLSLLRNKIAEDLNLIKKRYADTIFNPCLDKSRNRFFRSYLL